MPIGLFAQATDSESNREVQEISITTITRSWMRESYIKAVEGGYRSVNVLFPIRGFYYFNGEYEDAAKWYGALFSYSEDIDKEYLYRYAQSQDLG